MNSSISKRSGLSVKESLLLGALLSTGGSIGATAYPIQPGSSTSAEFPELNLSKPPSGVSGFFVGSQGSAYALGLSEALESVFGKGNSTPSQTLIAQDARHRNFPSTEAFGSHVHAVVQEFLQDSSATPVKIDEAVTLVQEAPVNGSASTGGAAIVKCAERLESFVPGDEFCKRISIDLEDGSKVFVITQAKYGDEWANGLVLSLITGIFLVTSAYAINDAVKWKTGRGIQDLKWGVLVNTIKDSIQNKTSGLYTSVSEPKDAKWGNEKFPKQS